MIITPARLCAGLLMLAFCLAAARAATPSTPRLIPLPAELHMATTGSIVIANGAKIAAATRDAGARRAAARAIELVERVRGLQLLATGRDGVIRFLRVSRQVIAEQEGYRLDVNQHGITIAAASDAGLLHGAATLAQLLSPDTAFGSPVTVPYLSIRDQPRFAWRGVMLDVARHLLPIKDIETIIDLMAQHKLNTLQLHLTDDQGWRIEIKRYPDLTRIGAWRHAPTTGSASDGQRYGGFYTQDQLRALVAYAAERGVTIVPEIDMPGHAQAAVAAYPQFGVLGDAPPVSNEWGINPYLFNVDQPSLLFIAQVLDEVLAIFPSRYIHVGGDEAIKEQWQASPVVQARMRQLGIKDEVALQSWFIHQLESYLTRQRRRLIGWDEILEGGLPPAATVMSWQGEAGAITAASLGHDVVLSPGPVLYFDNLQSWRGDEPPGRLKVQTLADVYAYDPLPAGIAMDKAQHVLGAQANVWSEYLVTPEQVRHALIPRLDALAEITWSPKAARNWPDFLLRLEPQLQRYRRQGITPADSAFAVDFSLPKGAAAALRDGQALVALGTQAHHGATTYTLDGSTPSATSTLYTTPIEVPLGSIVTATTFTADGVALAAPRSVDLQRPALRNRDSAALEICPGNGIRLRVALTADASDGPAYSMNVSDSCWLYRAAPVADVNSIVIDIGRLARHYALRTPQRRQVVWRYNPSRFGTVMVRADTCEGPVVGSFPLPDPAASANRFAISGRLVFTHGLASEQVAERDLCILTIAPEGGPIYGIERVYLDAAPIL